MYRTLVRATTVTALVALVLAVLPVQAQSSQTLNLMTIPFDTQISAEEGRQIQIGRVPLKTLEGTTCTVTAIASNDISVHEGSTLTISTGNDELTLSNVERSELVTTSGTKDMTFGSQMQIVLLIGGDEQFSAGLEVTADCTPPEEVCEFNETLTASDPNCYDPCRYDTSIPADSEDCRAPEPPVQDNEPVSDNTDTPEVTPSTTQTPTSTETVGKGNLPTTGPSSSIMLTLAAGAVTALFSYKRQRA